MAAMKSKQFEEEAAVKVHRIRITLTSRNVKNLEKGERAIQCHSCVGRVHCLATAELRVLCRARVGSLLRPD